MTVRKKSPQHVPLREDQRVCWQGFDTLQAGMFCAIVADLYCNVPTLSIVAATIQSVCNLDEREGFGGRKIPRCRWLSPLLRQNRGNTPGFVLVVIHVARIRQGK
jgi:hypothetical protein